jgi:GxxExxY protein
MTEEDVGRVVLDCAMKVHRALGPGLLESAYESCLAYEVLEAGLRMERQLLLPLKYKGVTVDAGYRVDLLVANLVVVEVKAAEAISDVHRAQLLSYLKLGGWRLGYILNFNVAMMREGVRRMVNGL